MYETLSNKFFPIKKSGTSRFTGVHKNRENSFVSRITLPDGSREVVGYFQTEIEAAYFYNKRATDVYGEEAVLNLLSDKEIALAEEKEASAIYFPYRDRAITVFSCVKRTVNQWYFGFKHEGVYHHVGGFESDIEAALAYNYYLVKYEINRMFNKVDVNDDKIHRKVIKILSKNEKYFPPNINKKTMYTCVKQSGNRWVAGFYSNKKFVYIGSYDTDREAAVAYNEYVKEHNLNRKLNFVD